MATSRSDYYVYVYINPRNFQEFYYGKGRGSRKEAHLLDRGTSDKAERIRAIKTTGKEPIIRVVAASLTEEKALLVEKTLLWKLGHHLTNLSSGHFANNFRPLNTLHQNLHGFDFSKEIYYTNVGECELRVWEDCRKYNFLSAGGGKQWSDQIRQLNESDVVVAYLKHHGYVGVGIVTSSAVPVNEFKVQGKLITKLPLCCKGLLDLAEDDAKTEYLVGVDWKASKPAEEAIWKPKHKLFTTPLVVASLANQRKTLAFVEKNWGVDLTSIAL